eukprot:scaffold4824_cov145-Isochrysis_galbana.AAC.7
MSEQCPSRHRPDGWSASSSVMSVATQMSCIGTPAPAATPRISSTSSGNTAVLSRTSCASAVRPMLSAIVKLTRSVISGLDSHPRMFCEARRPC